MTACSVKDNSTEGNFSWNNSSCPLDQLKVPAYNFYEILRLLGDQHGVFLSGASNYYPHNSDLFHIITVAATHIGSVFCVYPPNPPSGPSQGPWTLDYSIVGIAWPTINWYQFQIDGTLSNGFSAAGGPAAEPVAMSCNPDVLPATSIPLPLTSSLVSVIRQNQEFSVVASQVAKGLLGGKFSTAVNIPAYTTTIFWLTENTMDTPDQPMWAANPYTVDTADYGSAVVLRWQPNLEPTFYSYQVTRDGKVISPNPLRSALWVDTSPSPGPHTYTILAISASNVPSLPSVPMTVTV